MAPIRFIVFGFVALLIFFTGIASLVQNGNQVTIEMTDTGFQPSEITISQGDTVVFRSTGERGHWVASNYHPTHTVYPNSDIRKCGTVYEPLLFDACTVIEPGEEYRFTFHEAGVWNFHDHVAPRYSGRIIVSKAPPWRPVSFLYAHAKLLSLLSVFSSEKNPLENVADIPGFDLRQPDASGLLIGQKVNLEELFSSHDYESETIFHYTFDDIEIRKVVFQLGVTRTMEKILEESDGGTAFDCHIAAHYVGRAAYDVFGVSALKECNASCHSGCYHGAMEALFWERGVSETTAHVNKVCSAFDSLFARSQCYHGSGHGFLALSDYDVPGALTQCESLGDVDATDSCYGGVFMENIVTAVGLGAGLTGHSTDWLSLTDMDYPCDTLNGSPGAQKKCYGMQTSWMFVLAANDYEKVIDACRRAPTTMIPECFRGFGRDSAGNSLRSPEVLDISCSSVPEEFRPACILGGVDVVIDFWGTELHDQVSRFCDALSENARADCYQRLIERIPDVFSDMKKQGEVCTTMQSPYSEQCLSAFHIPYEN